MSNFVAIITEEQATELAGQELAPYWLFYPAILDNNWTISKEEIDGCVNEQYMWVKDLPLIPYVPAE